LVREQRVLTNQDTHFVTLAAPITAIAICLSLIMTGAWAVAIRSGQSGWVDAIWSFAVGGAGVAASLYPVGELPQPTLRQFVVAGLATLWSLRLGLHIVARTRKGGDDPRYAALREEWDDQFRSRLFWFLQIQAACALLLVIAIAVAAHNPAPALRFSDWLGVLILAVAISGEAVADRQLTRFRADPANKGRVCNIGLWAFSRHPNYFFEWLGWLAYAVIAIDLSGAYPWGWIALCGPAFMYWLLVHVSGIPPLEAHMLRSRGDSFRAYQARVNAFWPGPSVPASSLRTPKSGSP
jgi:steroid 5-alpha reductase family enzyme